MVRVHEAVMGYADEDVRGLLASERAHVSRLRCAGKQAVAERTLAHVGGAILKKEVGRARAAAQVSGDQGLPAVQMSVSRHVSGLAGMFRWQRALRECFPLLAGEPMHSVPGV